MKRNGLLMMAAVSLIAASCGNTETEVAEEAVSVTYALDTEASSLKWHGEENEEHFHDGTIHFTEGTFTVKGDEVESGQFVIDATSITPKTEGYPDEKMAYLKSHLMDTAFLFTAEYPTVTVSTGAYTDGKLSTTINVRGVDITTEIPVEVVVNEESATISGDFSVDFAKSNMPYLNEINPETGKPGAKSEFSFTMNLKLKKQ